MKTVLVVEDNEDDLYLLRMACKRAGIPHHFQSVEDGQLAIDYLAGKAPYADRQTYPFPNLVFLDIKMPRRDGHYVLKWIRNDAEMRNLPVVMLTSSARESDISRAYELGVTSYLRKMASPAEFGQAVRVILKYWLELNVALS